MSHVLLDGEERKLAAVRSLLMQWGVTSGPVPASGGLPTVHDGDAVILVGRAAAERAVRAGMLPSGPGGAAGPAAPLVLLAEGGRPGALPDGWLVLDDLDTDGTNLRLALRSSLARARALRGDPLPAAADAAGRDNYLHFLGHELRSPLTAIKTALEVLEGELGGPGCDDGEPDAARKMLGIALRNVRRLHHTVEWSQDLLASRTEPAVARPRQTAVAELAARFARLGEVRTDGTLADADVVLDPGLLEAVVTQMARALEMSRPERPLHVALAAGDNRRLDVLVTAADGEDLPAPDGHRTRLVERGETGDGREELERLARFMVAPEPIAALAADLDVVDFAGQPALLLQLAVAPTVAHPA